MWEESGVASTIPAKYFEDFLSNKTCCFTRLEHFKKTHSVTLKIGNELEGIHHFSGILLPFANALGE